MKTITSQSNLRKKFELMYRKYLAIMILTGRPTGKELKRSNQSLKNIPTLSRRELQDRLPELKKDVEELSKLFGVTGRLKDLEFLTDSKHSPPPPRDKMIRYTTKYQLETVFAHYEHALPCFQDLPPHARIGIDIFGLREKAGDIEVFQLEISLFEDMASLWNAILEFPASDEVKKNMIMYRRLRALMRATTKAAFNLLEGYINGMAVDITHTQKVTLKDLVKLTEWDEEKSRPKMLSLREKLLQYPKIALGEQHPPLNEGNCPEMKKILEMEQHVRHALIHPTPRIDKRLLFDQRESVYLLMTREEIAELSDITVELIYKLNDVIKNRFGKVESWLYRRDATGRFPDEVFL